MSRLRRVWRYLKLLWNAPTLLSEMASWAEWHDQQLEPIEHRLAAVERRFNAVREAMNCELEKTGRRG